MLVTGSAVPKAINDGVATSAQLAVVIDVGWWSFFGAVHSAMTRASCKWAWTRLTAMDPPKPIAVTGVLDGLHVDYRRARDP